MKGVQRTTSLLLVALAFVFFCSAAPSWPMEMKVEGDRLVMIGPIDGLDHWRFTQRIGGLRVVELQDSSGGDVIAELNIGHEMRRRGLRTRVKGYCRSSCANMFLGGAERVLVDERSYVAFHSGYRNAGDTQTASPEWIGKLGTYYAELVPGLPDDLLQVILHKRRSGFVYFFRDKTYNCEGTEAKRPSGCKQLPVSALEQGIITSLDDGTSPTINILKPDTKKFPKLSGTTPFGFSLCALDSLVRNENPSTPIS